MMVNPTHLPESRSLHWEPQAWHITWDAVPLYDKAALDAAVAAERERCAVVAWTHYMDTCKKHGRAPSMWHEWCAADVIRGA